MVVALGASDGEPKPDRPHGIHAVDDLLDTPFFGIRAPFGIRGRVAMEAGGYVLLRGAAREQVARHLLDREPIEGHVRVERIDYPVAITPGVRPQGVTAKPVAIGVAGKVEPVASPLLAVVGRIEQPVEQVAVSAGACIAQEGIDFGGRGREADQIEMDAADQRGFPGFGRGSDTPLLQSCQNEVVDRIADPGGIFDDGFLGTFERLECPVHR